MWNKGDKIEVIRNAEDHGGRGGGGGVRVWFPATLLESPYPGGKLHVKFDTLFEARAAKPSRGRKRHVKEYVDVVGVRPVPPVEIHRRFLVGEEVEVFHENGWWRGEVREILEDSKYRVAFRGGDGVEEVEVDQWRVRVRRHWNQVDGSWVPSPPLVEPKENSSQSELRTKKELKLKIICNPRPSGTVMFEEGTPVEVKSDEEGYKGSWFPATIVESLGHGKFVVEYQTLRTDDETELLKEEADSSYIRPHPPWTERHDRFEQLEQVDVEYNGGWWVGYISEVLDEFLYLVYFSTTNEEMKCEHSQLRPHQEWIDHKWVTASKLKRKPPELNAKELKSKAKHCRKISDPTFNKGSRVEVKSDEAGYSGSWFTAVVIGSAGDGNFLVEYDTLRTDDESQPLVEKAVVSYIRPLPPKIQRFDRFKILEEVDAWYNDGWWVGLISKVLPRLKYVVYFWTTNEELVFEHSKIRPHQEFIDGKWIASFLRPRLHRNSRIDKVRIETAGNNTSIGGLFCGLKVEIASGEDGCLRAWYPAVVLGPNHKGKYKVEYRTLKTDNGLELLKEEVDALCIRPCPPIIQQAKQFRPRDKVDIWYNDGWWIGQICKIVEHSKYMVYFRATNTVMEFQHTNLRPHQDLIDGRWIIATEDMIARQ